MTGDTGAKLERDGAFYFVQSDRLDTKRLNGLGAERAWAIIHAWLDGYVAGCAALELELRAREGVSK